MRSTLFNCTVEVADVVKTLTVPFATVDIPANRILLDPVFILFDTAFIYYVVIYFCTMTLPVLYVRVENEALLHEVTGRI